MSSQPPKETDELARAVERRRNRRELAHTEAEHSVSRNLALIGALGWTIVAPTLVGLFVGRWLDRVFDWGAWATLTLLIGGIVIGSAMAWKRMQRE